ncbi:MAG TPA: oxidoreductase [Chthoniobacteraceae bacterium]|jgi:short-subunit dehydrogenase
MKRGSKVVLITGVSSGIGRATAQIAAAAGHTVYGTSRKPDSVEPIPGLKIIAMDVRDDDSVQKGIATVRETEGRIDVLVNNAGITLFGAVEETAIDEAKALFETNFFGVVRTTHAVLPEMRARGSGHVIIVGSMAGFLPTPFETMYGASKHALECYAESLSYEVEPFGIAVSLLEPGFVRTAMDRNYTEAQARIDAYAKVREKAVNTANSATRKGADPERVGRIILRAMNSAKPKLRYLAGWDAVGTRLARSLVPPPLFAMGVRAEVRIK